MRILSIVTAMGATAAFAIVLSAQSLDVQLQRSEQKEIATGDLKGAINDYKRIADRAKADRAVASKALLRMAEAHQKLGDAEAKKIYQQIVRDYADQQPTASTAQARLTESTALSRRLWSVPADSGMRIGRVSPDGRYLAFTTIRELMVRDLTTGTEHTVQFFTSGRAGPTLAWSPDSRQIAFEFTERGTEIRATNPDGSGMRTILAAAPGWARVLDYFPDGDRLLASMGQGSDSKVFAIRVTDGSIQNLVVRSGGGSGTGWPRLSPDGRYVALRNLPGLSLLAVDGSGETIISRNAGDLNAAGWSPDGSRLLFVRQQDGRVDLWAVPVADGKLSGPSVLLNRDFGSINVIENQVARDGSLFYVKYGVGTTELHKLEKIVPQGN